MGNGNSLPNVEGFSRDEVARLEKRFLKLDLDHSGTISVGEFLSVPELKENPLVQRVVDVLDSDLSGEVDFKGLPRTSTSSFVKEFPKVASGNALALI